MSVVSSSHCANCNKSYGDCSLQRCGGCSLRYYCSAECQRADWNDHKAQCRLAQSARKAKIRGDSNHPFERAITVFEAESFTETAFVDFVCTLSLEHFIDAASGANRTDLDGVTESGFLRLLPLAVRALSEYPDSDGVVASALQIFGSYASRYCNATMGYARVDALFQANALDAIVRYLRSQSSERILRCTAWSLLSAMCHTERKKLIEAIRSVGIMDLAMEALRAHGGTDQHTSMYALEALGIWLQVASVRGVAVPMHNVNALILNVILAMRRFPDAEALQGDACHVFRQLLFDNSISPEDRQVSPVVATLASMGAYELVVTAIQRFPAARDVIMNASMVAGTISQMHFAERTKPRNTEGAAALAACLPHYTTDSQTSEGLVINILQVMDFSVASSANLVSPGGGLRLLRAALQNHTSNEELVNQIAMIVATLCSGNSMRSTLSAVDYAQFVVDLEREALPALLQALRLHMNSITEGNVYNLLVCLVSLSRETQRTYPELAALVREAMRLHPSDQAIQARGSSYLRSIGM